MVTYKISLRSIQRSILTCLFIFFVFSSNAQNIAITDSSAYEANSSAVLDVQSSNKGMLIPRMDALKRTQMANPANGLMVYDTTINSFYYYQDSVWIALSSFDPNAGTDESLFAILNTSGDTVFAVYNDGVEVIVDRPGTKSKVGGFAVSGRTVNKTGKESYMKITPEVTSFTINQSSGKSRVGGFAVSGRTVSKSTAPFMDLTPDNYFIGHNSGEVIGNGTQNVFFGYQAGKSNVDGGNNVFLGYQAGYNNVGYNQSEGSNNIFIGTQAGYNNLGASDGEYGQNNVFIGKEAGFSNQNGPSNIFIGTEAGYNNIGSTSSDGGYNVFLGYRSGKNNISGAKNVYIGVEAGELNETGSSNVYVGDRAGETGSGGGNTYIGKSSGYRANGDGNAFFGSFAGSGDSDGTHDVNNNTFIGNSAGKNLRTGLQNVIIGNDAGLYIDSANYNVIIGAGAGSGNGSANNPGMKNVLIGYQAGYWETGDEKLYIENSSSTSPLIYGDFASDFIAINGKTNNSYNFYVNGDAGGSSTWNSLSDKRLKENISPIDNSLDKVLKLEGVNFEWKDKKKYGEGRDIGFIAQDMEKVLPEAVNNNGEYYSVQYGKVNTVLVEAVKEQQKMIKKLEERIEELEKKIEK